MTQDATVVPTEDELLAQAVALAGEVMAVVRRPGRHTAVQRLALTLVDAQLSAVENRQIWLV